MKKTTRKPPARRPAIAKGAADTVLNTDPLAAFTGASSPARNGVHVEELAAAQPRPPVMVRTSISFSEEDYEWLRQEAIEMARQSGTRRTDAGRVIAALISAERSRRSRRSSS